MSERQKVELRDNGSFQNEVYNLCSFIFLAPERDVDLPLKAEDSADDDDEPKAEEQEDEGDWEQVGPKNKSMVTRMVSAPPSPFPPPQKKRKERRLFLLFVVPNIFQNINF